MSFLPQDEKDYLDGIFDELHDTFAKTMYAHQAGEVTVVSHNPNYSSVYGSPSIGSSGGSNKVLKRVSFRGRILFDQKQHQRPVDVGDDSALKLKLQDGTIRLKVDLAGDAIISKAKKIEINEELFEFETKDRPHGLFAHTFKTYYLRRLD